MKNPYSLTNAVFAPAFYFKQKIFAVFAFLLVTLFSTVVHAQNFRSSAQAGADDGDKTLSISKPSGTISGDVMVASISVRPYNATITPPTGWNLVLLTKNSSGDGDNAQAIYWKVAGGLEPTSYTWTFNKSEGSAGGILTFYNINTSNPINVYDGRTTTSSLTHATPSVTTTVPNAMVIASQCFGSSATWTTPSGMTQPVDVASHSVPYETGESMCMSYVVQSSAGATGTKTATASAYAEVGVAQIVALVPNTTISYATSPYCSNEGTATVTRTGATGGIYSSTSGLSINATTGAVDLDGGAPGTYTVTYRYGTGYTYSTTTTITIYGTAALSATSTPTCVGGSTGTITGTATGGNTPYTYSLNSGTYQSSATFTALAAGTYTVNIKTNTGCVSSTSVTVSPYANSSDDQSASGINSWIGHAYKGKTFTNYIGHFTETETFNELFGGTTTCFNVISNSQTRSLYTEDFAVRYLMTSSKNGLYVADLASDDGSRLTVDGTLVYNSWNDHSYGTNVKVLMNLDGNSLLNYEYYENSGDNQVSFQNLTLVLNNNLSNNTTQSVCLGSTGSVISGDTYGTLPSGITLSGTGYQWSYSTTPGGARTNISGATGATFTPSATVAPFNLAGTYYVYRSAIVSSSNNLGVSPYIATNLSDAAVVTVNAVSVGGSVSSSTSVCSGTNSGTLSLSGQTGNVVRWESSVNGTTWITIANTTASLTYTNLTATTQYRAVVQSGVCSVANSAAATITVNAVSVGGSVSSSTSVCSGTNSGTLSLSGQTGSVVRWESSVNGTTWTAIANTTASLTYTNLTATTQYRALVQSGVCSITNSTAATITVNAVSVGGSVSSNTSVCSGTNSGTLSLSGQTGSVIRWESSVNGTTWTTIANTTASLTYTNLTTTTQYRAVVQSGVCSIANSTAATITVNAVSVGGSVNSNTSVCSGTNSGTLSLSGQTGSVVRWESSVNGTTWTTISNTTASLTYTNLTTTTQYRAVVQSGACSIANSAAATITVNTAPSATISYANSPYCSSSGTATVTRTGTAGGTYSSASGLVIDAATGDVTLASSAAGIYTVSYVVTTTCGTYTATTTVTITTQPSVTGNYPGNPYCTNYGIAYPTGSKTGADGVLTSQAGLSINSSNGVVDLGASTPGNYTITYTVPAAGGCALYTNTYNLVIIGSPSATISYAGTPYCPNAGIIAVTRTGTAGGVYSSTAGLSITASTGDVNINLSSPGTYTVTYKIAAAGSCAAFTTTTSITIKPAGTWTGITSSNWNIPTNWECGVVPNRTTNVIIPTGTPFYPILTNITAAVNNLTLQSGATITLNSGNFKIAGLAATTGGKIMATAGKVTFNGTVAQTIPSRLFSSNTILDLVDSNTVKLTLGDTVRVTGTVGFDYVNNSELASNGFLILVSTNAKTANLTDVTNYGINTNNTVTGDVTVERYTQGRRAYRFLTAPVNSTTSIKANWMEGVNNTSPYQNNNPLPGYGTHITGSGGSANGFDMTSTNNPSLYSFNITGQAWTPAANTNGTYKAGNGFRIMVRGSRSVDLNDNNAAPSTTTLRAKGTVVTGAVTFTKTGGGGTANMPALTNVNNAYSLIANPYPSTVDWSQIALASDFTDLSPWIYVFDPTLGGSGARGVYVAYDGKNKKKSNLSSLIDNNLQSGQAFFLMTTGPNPSLTFQEKYKVTNSLQIFRTTSDVPVMNVQLLLPEQVNTTGSADGAAVYFSDDYTNSIGTDDAFKFTNQDENLAILRNGQALSVEGRKPVSGSDSIPLKLWQLTSKNYTIKITLDKFADNVESYLQDKYLKTTTQLSNGETLVPFTITADAASAASDRFMVVFESFATLPVRLTGIKAYEKNKGVQVEWTAESESNMDLYEIQRSSDARDFTTIGSAKAKNNTSISTTYSGFDAKPLSGDNYYRIKSIEKSGDVKESEVVKVNISSGKNGVSVVNNPVNGKTIQLLFNNVEKGNYEVSLINIAGEKVYSGRISYTGGTLSQQLELKSYMASGLYQLRLLSGSTVKNVSVLMQ